MTTETKLSLVDEIRSLTGFEELKIEERFHRTIGDLIDLSYPRAGRAVLFVRDVRDGKKEGEAFKAAMSLTLGEVNELFRDEEEDADDFDPEDPDSEQGKGDESSD